MIGVEDRMHKHTCPRCEQTFSSFALVGGRACRSCTEGNSDWHDLAPTSPRVVIPVRVISLSALALLAA